MMSLGRASFGYLHLFGLSLGTREQNWRWSRTKELLFADLERLYARVGSLDLVFLTGELTRTGAAKEFDQVDRELEQLYKLLYRLGSTPQLVAVPGVHDLMVAEHPFDPVVRDLRNWHDDAQLRDYVLGVRDNPYLVRQRAAFANYTTWDERGLWRRPGRSVGLLPGDSAVSLAVGGLEIGVVGLNSAFCALAGDNAGASMDVDPRQLHAVCGHDAPEWLGRHHLNFLMTRHPWALLAPQARLEFSAEVDVPGRFAAHVCGDGDGTAARETSDGGARPRRVLPGVPLCASDGPRGYSVGRVELTEGAARLQVFPRRVHRYRIDRAQDCDLDEHDALCLTLPVAAARGRP